MLFSISTHRGPDVLTGTYCLPFRPKTVTTLLLAGTRQREDTGTVWTLSKPRPALPRQHRHAGETTLASPRPVETQGSW